MSAWRRYERCFKKECTRNLVTGELVFQVATGSHWIGHVTPTGEHVIGEWHEECFRELFPELVHPQARPYKCFCCKGLIERNEKVVYSVLGAKPTSPYVRPEDRVIRFSL